MTATARPDISTLVLLEGGHRTRAEGVCLLEAVAWVAGEKHSDSPACACPVVADYGRRINDRMPGELRTKLLRPFVEKLVGSRSTPEVERLRREHLRKRSTEWADKTIREDLPKAFDATARALTARGFPTQAAVFSEHAGKLRALAPLILPFPLVGPATAAARAAYQAAWDARWAVSRAVAVADAAVPLATLYASMDEARAKAREERWTIAVELFDELLAIK